MKSWQNPFFAKFIILTLLLFSALPAWSQSTVEGTVMEQDGSPIAYAKVQIQDAQIGALTDSTGHFELAQVPEGSHTLSFGMMGFYSYDQEIEVEAGQNLQLEIQMEANDLTLDPQVITGSTKPTFVKDSPIKVDVITGKYVQQNLPATNLVEAIALVNGVQEVTACGVCFTNSISINGLPGPYTAVLMDGNPIYGNLASVYGLNGIPVQMIDRFEVIKGPNSTLYGSEAVAGVINIITKDPKDAPLLSVDLMGTSHREAFGNVALSQRIGKAKGYVGANWAYLNDFEDFNEDGLGDGINMDRISLFTKWSFDRPSGKPFEIAGKAYYEDRRNGVEEFLQDRAYRELRGNDSLYGESIYTRRAEVFGKYVFNTKDHLRLNYSYSFHDQDSYYGSDQYVARQQIGFANLVWVKQLGRHLFSAGMTQRYQFYDDNTVATQKGDGQNITNNPSHQYIPGLFVQNEWDVTDQFTLLAGGRVDHYSSHGPIFSPRLNLRFKPGEWTTLRANFGTGFRVVNLFTEDHAFVTGQREVEILESLDPERSWNASLNFNHIYSLGDFGQGTLDLDAYYTRFRNKIIPNYDTPGKIIYENSDGFAQTMGIGANLSHSFDFPLSLNLGANFQRVTETEPDENGAEVTRDIEFAARWSTISTVNYNWRQPGIRFAYTLRVTGPMALPEVFDLDEQGNPLETSRPTASKPFAFQNIQVTKTFKKGGWQIYGGLQNMFNYRQELPPVVGYNDPNSPVGFSSYFDTAYAYSPVHGREVYLGFRWEPKFGK